MTEDEKKKTANLEDVQAFGRIIHNKGIGSEGTCSTAAATAAKTVTVGTTFKPVAGATLIVTFQNAITVANATLAVTYGASGSQQTLAAKPIYYRGSALAANLVEAGATLVLRYDGTNYNIIGSLQIDPFPSQSGNNGKFLKTDGSAVSWAPIPSDNTKADKVSGATNGNFAGLDANGNIKDSGKNENSFQLKVTDCAMLGGGYVTCSTAGGIAAKTATISDFILLKNGFVAIRFVNAVNVADATLNISNTGAKNIKINGDNLQPGVIKAGMTAVMVYDGTAYNIVAMMGLENGGSPSDLYVDMGLPSGVLWAKKNIDVTQADGFAASEYQYECSFCSWGNTQMHNPISNSVFDYNWGTGNDGPYADTPGAALTGNISPSFDAARANLGAPWRMPTTGEFVELFANIDYIDAEGEVIAAATTNKLITMNSIVGIRLKSKINNAILFFPCSGHGAGTSWDNRGSSGLYWSSSLYSATYGRGLGFLSGGVGPQVSNVRFYGFAVRPVQ